MEWRYPRGRVPGPGRGPGEARADEAVALLPRDLMALSGWMGRAEMHGYRRASVEVGRSGAGPDLGGYVLLYPAGGVWAEWGLMRTAAGVVAWRCATGLDVGCFPTMERALDGLPPRRAVRKPMQRIGGLARCNVVRLDFARRDAGAKR